MKPRRIFLYVILPAMVIYFGMRFYVQYRPVNVLVSRTEQMPVELANGLHMEEHKISPIIQIESPYESTKDKMLSMEEIRTIRAKLAWSKTMPVVVDLLIIRSTNQVQTRRFTRRFIEECELVKVGSEWSIKSGTRTEVKSVATQSN